MALPGKKEAVPLETTADGAVLLAGTRVTLDTLVTAFRLGATPEEIVHQYPSLALADVYAVIGYYLHNRGEVEDYLRDREKAATKVRDENESRFDPQGIRERLLGRGDRNP